MPDWTYHPLRPLAAGVLGRRRSERAALRALARLASLPGGSWVVGQFSDRCDRSAAVAARLGVTVSVEVAPYVDRP